MEETVSISKRHVPLIQCTTRMHYRKIERGGKLKKSTRQKTALCTKNQQEKSSRKSRLTENGSTCNKEINTWIIFFGNKIPVLVMNTLQKLGGRQTGDHGWWTPDTHQPSEGGDKMGGDSLFWITRIILASLQTFHVNVFIIHEFLNEIKKMSVYEMKGRQLLPAGCLAWETFMSHRGYQSHEELPFH